MWRLSAPGYTGLNAALETARGGRSYAGYRCRASRLRVQHAQWRTDQHQHQAAPLPSCAKTFGLERGRAIHREGSNALEWIGDFVAAEGIDCDFQRSGRFHAAHTPAQYESLARSIGDPADGEATKAWAVPRSEQRT